METREHTILAEKKSEVEYRLNSLNKRARKLGLEEISWKFGKAYTETREVLTSDPVYSAMPPKYVKKDLLVIPISITGPFEVKVSGWQFVAVIDHFFEGNVIRKIGDIELPIRFRTVSCNCEHCNVNRKRNATYILRNENEFKQVGSTCIKDFLGGNCPDDIAQRANFACDIISYLEAGENYGGGKCDVFSLEEFVSHTVAVINKYGWTSSKIAKEKGIAATYTLVDCNMFGGAPDYVKAIVTDEDREKAKEILDWAENLSDKECENDYMYTIRTVALTGCATVSTMGIAASIVAAYKNNKEQKEVRKNSQHVGNVKDRAEFELTVKTYFSFAGTYGVSYKYILTDKDNNVFVWTTNNSELEENKTYKIKGTIKEHSTYKDVAQTILTRCTVM